MTRHGFFKTIAFGWIALGVAGMTAAADDKAGVPPTTLTKIDTTVGNGKEAVAGKVVTVHYTGWLWDAAAKDHKGAKFDSSVDRGDPFRFPLGMHRVIRGWDEGVPGMKIGGKRTLVIPSEYGYGKRGAGSKIPPDATLVFDVEILDVAD